MPRWILLRALRMMAVTQLTNNNNKNDNIYIIISFDLVLQDFNDDHNTLERLHILNLRKSMEMY